MTKFHTIIYKNRHSNKHTHSITFLTPITPPTSIVSDTPFPTAPSRPAPARECHRRTHSHSATVRADSTTRSYHVELSNTLYGGDLRTPDTPSLMTQSMDPAILSQLAGTAPRGHNDLMSRSLGAEQMTRSLGLDPMTQSMEDDFKPNDLDCDLMVRSHDPKQMGQPDPGDLMTRSLDLSHLTNGEAEVWGEHLTPPPHGHPRPTSLFGADGDLTVEDMEHQGSQFSHKSIQS